MTVSVPRLVATALAVAAATAAAVGLSACGGGDGDENAATSVRRPASPPALCGRLRVRDAGRVEDTEAVELSGLVASRTRPGVLWAHNDSGDRPRLFALTTRARVLGSFEVTGAQAQDWEDIATGPGPGGGAGGGAVLYAADIGDNDARRDTVVVYRVAEPDPSSGGGATAAAGALTLRYPDGPHDAEALLVDPRRARLAIVTKSLDGAAGVYTAPIPTALPARRTLRRAGALALGLANPVTAGDVSADGAIVVLRSYSRLFAWNLAPRESLARALRRPPCASPTALTEPQGEAVALVRAGRVALTVSEGSRPVLRRYTPAP